MAQWGSQAILAGLVLQLPLLWAVSGFLVLSSLVFAAVTLPVERDASQRALRALKDAGLANAQEIDGARRVLRAAAFTYLAGMAQRLGTLMFLAVAMLALFGILQR